MPRLSKLMIRASLLHLGAGFLIGALLLWNKGIPFAPALWRLRAGHIEILIFGWMMQLAMGAAFWILPRFSSGHRYGKERLGWASFVLLNGGVVLAAIAQGWGTRWALWALVGAAAGRVLIVLAAIAYVRLMWPRVKPFGAG